MAKLMIIIDVDPENGDRDDDPMLIAHDVLGDHTEADGYTLVHASWPVEDPS